VNKSNRTIGRVGFTAEVSGAARVRSLGSPAMNRELRIATLYDEPVNGMSIYDSANFTAVLAQRCHPDSQNVLGALRQRSHLGSRKSPTGLRRF
jgi:hypothetical protein